MTKKKEGKKQEEKTEQKEQPTEEARLDFKCNGYVLQSIMNSIGEIHNEAPFKITKDAITVTVVDVSHVAMLTLEIPARNFYHGKSDDVINKQMHYEATGDLTACFDVEEIKQDFVKILTPTDKVTGYITPTEMFLKTDHLNKLFSSIDGVTEAKAPKMENNTRFKIPDILLPTFMRAISEKEYVEIHAGKEGIWGKIHKDTNDERPLNFLFTKASQDHEAKSLYSCEYLTRVFKATGQVEIIFQMDTDSPCVITTDYLDNGKATCLLAPRIESE